jgi:uncharacterized protein YcsI (UPF0317 family)
MRPFLPGDVAKAVEVTARFPRVHGAPVHVGSPEAIGVDLARPDYGDAVHMREGEVPVFWACAVFQIFVAMVLTTKHNAGIVITKDGFPCSQVCVRNLIFQSSLQYTTRTSSGMHTTVDHS